MDNNHIWVAIIAGGQGTRLFPISHTSCPKQFCKLDKDNTFIQAVVANFATLGIKKTHDVVVTTSDTQSALAKEQVLQRGVLSQNIYQIDPNFGYPGAMYEVNKFIHRLDEDAIVINTPSDQFLSANEDFAATINAAVEEAKKDAFVIIGAKVNDIVTAMGCGHAIYVEDDNPCHDVTGFVEKPSFEEADRIMRQGNVACNTGINVWKAKNFLNAFDGVNTHGMGTDVMMERLGNLKIAVGNFEWHDCGTLKSLYEISKKTPNHKNASLGEGSVERINCRRSLLYAGDGMELRVTGAEDDAIVFTTINEKPIIVVAKLDESQKIKNLAEDYSRHEAFLTEDFSFGARNNIVLGSDVSDELIVGFVGVRNYAVYAHRRPDGMMEAVVSKQLTRE